jgi:hypothetical protein
MLAGLRQARGPCRLELTGLTCCTAQLHPAARRDQDQSLRVVPTVKVGVTLSLKQVGAQYRYNGLCTNRCGCRYGVGKFADLRGLGPVVNNHAMARTHFISNQHTSPIALTKSAVFLRIVTAASQRHVDNITSTSPCAGAYRLLRPYKRLLSQQAVWWLLKRPLDCFDASVACE